MDAPCRGLIVLAQVEAAVSRDPAAREQSLSCVTKKLPPVPSTHGRPDASTAANKGTWQGMAYGQVSPNPTLPGGLEEGSRATHARAGRAREAGPCCRGGTITPVRCLSGQLDQKRGCLAHFVPPQPAAAPSLQALPSFT